MYSAFGLAKKYIKYYFNASNGNGHGIHSPFVFDFIINVLRDTKKYDCYYKIENLRNTLLNNNSFIDVEDFGAGSAVIPFKKRKINAIAKSSLKKKKYAQLLFRVAKYYKPKIIVELGTSFGITTCYLASAHKQSTVYTFEGSREIAGIALQNFARLNFQNMQLANGNFDDTFIKALEKIDIVDLAFIDGNHRKQPTLNYFNQHC